MFLLPHNLKGQLIMVRMTLLQEHEATGKISMYNEQKYEYLAAEIRYRNTEISRMLSCRRGLGKLWYIYPIIRELRWEFHSKVFVQG